MKVKVYYNLHNHKWSIKDSKTGLVLGYATNILLQNAIAKVSELGRQRVLLTKHKNVHAILEGTLVSVENFTSRDSRKVVPSGILPATTRDYSQISYNPYKAPTFIWKHNSSKFTKAAYIKLDSDKTVMASSYTMEDIVEKYT